MLSTLDSLHHLENIGLVLSIDAERGLKITPKEKITADGRAFIHKHMAEIFSLLSRRAKLNELPCGKDVHGGTSGMSKARVDRKRKIKPSPVALAWLSEHRQALDTAGWSRAELYRRNKSKQGLVWLRLWDEAFNRAYLHEDGTIQFECSIHGRDYFQTARPASMLVTPDSQNVNPKFRSVNNE